MRTISALLSRTNMRVPISRRKKILGYSFVNVSRWKVVLHSLNYGCIDIAVWDITFATFSAYYHLMEQVLASWLQKKSFVYNRAPKQLGLGYLRHRKYSSGYILFMGFQKFHLEIGDSPAGCGGVP